MTDIVKSTHWGVLQMASPVKSGMARHIFDEQDFVLSQGWTVDRFIDADGQMWAGCGLTVGPKDDPVRVACRWSMEDALGIVGYLARSMFAVVAEGDDPELKKMLDGAMKQLDEVGKLDKLLEGLQRAKQRAKVELDTEYRDRVLRLAKAAGSADADYRESELEDLLPWLRELSST